MRPASRALARSFAAVALAAAASGAIAQGALESHPRIGLVLGGGGARGGAHLGVLEVLESLRRNLHSRKFVRGIQGVCTART